jgi:hypothetical protein
MKVALPTTVPGWAAIGAAIGAVAWVAIVVMVVMEEAAAIILTEES